MRIIAGYLGGRVFDAPGTAKTHPMGDKIRGALFNILGDIEGLTVLDVFSGSGALGFEALSRGAQSVLAIEHDQAAQRVITHNIAMLGLKTRISLVAASVQSWLRANPDVHYDLVLCDPPYDNLQEPLLERLAAYINPEGVLVVSWPTGVALPDFPSLKKIAHRSYGDAQLVFYSNAN